ncbi:cysteine synthase A [uncultured Megasphaera sp.]|uniref:cysteine synthase A n=1 Tax=uncultured Megasphaera sp. TaxID=165188 RepID=UPI002591F368|nr:cysteine synthase A [uncultured Megasphaera sp.]
MSTIYTSALDLIGNTPLLEPVRYNAAAGIKGKLFVKLEAFNPAGSAKDRIAKAMIEDAEKQGLLKKGSVIIEPTSGNTGIGLAAVAAAKGYRAIFTMPETMSVERRNLIAAYGAEIVLTPGKEGMTGSVAKAEELASEIDGAYIPGQFTNPVNPRIHKETTGPEIYRDTDGAVDIFLAGVGTGGTLSGIGQYLKEQKPAVKIIAVEPKDSPLLSEGHAGSHKLQGIGANFVPKTLDTTIYDSVFTVTTEEAYDTARLFTQKEGLLIGISGGAALYAATRTAALPENNGKTIVVLLPDNGDRYLTTPDFIKAK